MNDLEKLKKQKEIDNLFIEEYGKAIYLNSEFIQMLTFSENEEIDENNTIFELININLQNEKMLKETIKTIKNILNKWSKIFNSDYEFLIGGSSMFGLNTINSDIDVIYVVTENTEFIFDEYTGNDYLNNDGTIKLISRASQFFGSKNSKCLNKIKEECSDMSFYCKLCLMDKIKNLKRITETRVPLLKFDFYGIKIDINFVQIPEKINNNNNWMNQALNNIKNSSLGKIYPLASYKSNLIIIDLLPKEQERIKIFKFTLISLKLWASNNSIYGNQFGFFNGVSLLILLTKIYLLYPNTTSILALLKRFFITFLTWNWPRTFLLEKIDNNLLHSWNINLELFSRNQTFINKQGIEDDWEDEKEKNKIIKLKQNIENIKRLEKHSKLIIPIITPAYPQQSSAYNINYSTMKIIKKTMIEGLKGINQIRQYSNFKEDWENWINGINFVDKYKHFVTIICLAIDQNIGEDFCSFVMNRIRVELILSLEEYQKLEYAHIATNKIKKGQCEKRLIASKKFKYFWENNWCKQWIVGLYLPEIDSNLIILNKKEKIILNYYFLKLIKRIKGKYLKNKKIERNYVSIHLRYTDIYEAKKFWREY